MEENAKAPFWKPALIYGAILGLIGIVLSVIFYVANLMVQNWTQWLSFLVTIVVMAYCLLAYRKEYLGGFATYGQIFVMALVMGIISLILSTIFSYILFAVIDPELLDKMRLATEEKMLARVPESAQEMIIERMDKNFQMGRVLIMGMVVGTVLSAVLGLILAAFIKKEENPAADL